MYADRPYAREVGHVEEAAAAHMPAGAATSAGVMEGHDVPLDVWNNVVYWLSKGGHDVVSNLERCRSRAVEGAEYCFNENCEVAGHLKDFKVCPQCKIARYCGAGCQKEDWITGGHREKCGTGEAFSPNNW
jgi:hypothetical protein